MRLTEAYEEDSPPIASHASCPFQWGFTQLFAIGVLNPLQENTVLLNFTTLHISQLVTTKTVEISVVNHI